MKWVYTLLLHVFAAYPCERKILRLDEPHVLHSIHESTFSPLQTLNNAPYWALVLEDHFIAVFTSHLLKFLLQGLLREASLHEFSQLCLTLCDPMGCSLPGSSVHGIFQARELEWVAISFSRGSSRPGDRTHVSHIAGRLFTVWATRPPWPTGLPDLPV